MKFADLHLHTRFSDGTFSPEELTGHARRLGFAALALTDHDSVEGCAPMAAACGAVGIEAITGTELTAEYNDTEVHLLGYFLDTQNQKLLTEIARFQSVRQDRIREMVAKLNQLKVPLEVNPSLCWPTANRPAARTWRVRWCRPAWSKIWTRRSRVFSKKTARRGCPRPRCPRWKAWN